MVKSWTLCSAAAFCPKSEELASCLASSRFTFIDFYSRLGRRRARMRRRARTRRHSRCGAWSNTRSYGWRHTRSYRRRYTRSYRRRHAWCHRRRDTRRRRGRCSTRTQGTIKHFSRGNDRLARIVATCDPDVIGPIGVVGGVAAGGGKRGSY